MFRWPAIIVAVSLLAPRPALGESEEAPTEQAQEEEAGEPCPGPTCKETYQDLLVGGNRRLAIGPVVMGAGGAGLAVSTAFLIDALQRSMKNGLTTAETEFSLFIMMPALFSAAILASGVIMTSIGAGMRFEAMRLVRKGVPLDGLCYPSWRAMHEFGRRHALIGTVFLVAGTEMFMIGLGSDISTRRNPDQESSTWGIGIIHAIFGALTMTAGIMLIHKGRKFMQHALEKKDEEEHRVSFLATPSGFVLLW